MTLKNFDDLQVTGMIDCERSLTISSVTCDKLFNDLDNDLDNVCDL